MRRINVSEPKYKYKHPVTLDVKVFDPVLFSVGSPVVMQIETSDWERMYWREEYGIVEAYNETELHILMVDYNGQPETKVVQMRFLDDRFNVIPLKELIKGLQEELDAK
ncbi:hypothetical protein JARJAR_206 [Bacillus phage vB_BanH_JarJar]|nr:hypothetical protein JARJAR_206 [Bacillus phage vB_BanH_JarJar]